MFFVLFLFLWGFFVLFFFFWQISFYIQIIFLQINTTGNNCKIYPNEKNQPHHGNKKRKGVLVKFDSSNRVSLLYFESQSRVTVSLRKQTYSSYGSLTRLISRENIDNGSDFKNIKRCFDHDDVDFKSFRKTKILGTCMYFFSLTLNCEVNPTLTVLYEQIWSCKD